MENKRIAYIDVIKAFTIFCVLWGHCIQQFDKNLILWNNSVMNTIYTFHMPLFYLLSGFFFRSSLKNSFREFAIKKTIQLLLPYVVWCVIQGLFVTLHLVFVEHSSTSFAQVLGTMFGGFFWFLRELFISYAITYISYEIFRKWSLAVVAGICFVLFGPFTMRFQSFYLPIFFIGIFISINYDTFKKHGGKIAIISGILFAVCLPFWKGYYYDVFLNFFSWERRGFNFSTVLPGLYRLLTGVSGAVFFFALFGCLWKENKVTRLIADCGQYTLEMYILQVMIIETILTRFINLSGLNFWVFSLIIAPVCALLVFVVCIIIIKIIQKSKIANLVLFGKGT